MNRFNLISKQIPGLGAPSAKNAPSEPVIPTQSASSTVAVASKGKPIADTLKDVGKKVYEKAYNVGADVAMATGYPQVIANKQAGQSFTEQVKTSGSSSANLAKQATESIERNKIYTDLVKKGVDQVTALKQAKYAFTGSQRKDVTNLVLGMIGGPDAEAVKASALRKVGQEAIGEVTPKVIDEVRPKRYQGTDSIKVLGDKGVIGISDGKTKLEVSNFNPDIKSFIGDIETRIPSPEYIAKADPNELASIRDDMQALRKELRDKNISLGSSNELAGTKQADTIQSAIDQTKQKLDNRISQVISNAEDHASTALWKRHGIPEGGYPEAKPLEFPEKKRPVTTTMSREDLGTAFVKEMEKVPTIDNVAQLRDEAAAMTELTHKGGIKGFSKELADQFRNWVNFRSASKTEGMAAKEKFKAYDELGPAGFDEVQKGRLTGDLRDFFNTKFKELKDAGVDLNYRDNYLPQLWQNSEQEVGQVFDRSLGLKPSFTFEALIKDYQEGIKMGLTPRFKTISEIASWYEQKANKALADRKFFDYLASKGFIVPQSKAPLGWKALDPNGFPKIKVRFGEGEYLGNFSAPPALQAVIDDYLKSPEGLLSDFAKFASATKNIVLTSGIPKTGINAHGLNILVRNTLASRNPISGFLRGAYYLLSPEAGEAYLKANLDKASDWVKSGLTLSSEDHAIEPIADNVFESGFRTFKKWQEDLFEKPLFTQIMPALKVQYAETIKKDLLQAFPEKEAKQKAAEITNNIFGGINYDALARTKEARNITRSLILAGDWAEAQIKTGKGVTKSLFTNSPESKIYRRFARNLVAGYASADTLNYVISGHHMYKNEAGHTFEIQMGTDSKGQIRYLRPFGTAVDFVRLPYDIALALKKGDLSSIPRIVANRLSIPAGVLTHLISNTDYMGRKILGKDNYGNPIPVKQQVGGVLSEVSGLGIPQYGTAAIDYLFGRSSGEEAITQALELPFRYKQKPKSKKNRFSF